MTGSLRAVLGAETSSLSIIKNQAEITAVVVAHEVTGGLAETVASVVNQQRPPQRVVLVTDNNASPVMVEKAGNACIDADIAWHHLVHPRNSAQSLAHALGEVIQEQFPAIEPDNPKNHWLWFMTSAAVAEPDALEELIKETEVAPSVVIAGAKQVEHARQRRLVNVGLTVSKQGEIFSLIDSGELDQGQYDDRDDVFAVSLPGMLVCYDMWQKLDGFDARTPVSGQAVDLCWRARLAGARVVVVPTAKIKNFSGAEIASRISALNGALEDDQPRYELPELRASNPTVAEKQETATWLNLKHRSGWSVVPMWLWSIVAVIGIFFGSLLLKAPGYGSARAGGSLRSLLRPIALLRSRSQAARTRTASYKIVDELRPNRETLRDYRRTLVELNEPGQTIGDGTGSSATDYEPTGGHDDFTALATPERSWVGLGLVTAIVILGILSVVGMFTYLGAEALAGGALAPITETLGGLFRSAVTGWSEAGVGAAGYAGPGNWLLVLLGLTGSANISVVVLYLIAMPLAAAGAWTMLGAITRSRGARFILAMVWGIAPTLLIAMAQGRLGAIIVHLALPWLVLAIIRATGSAAEARLDPEGQPSQTLSRPGFGGVPSWTASGWTAILLAIITAASPSLLVPGTIFVLLIALFLRRRGRPLWWTPLLSWSLFLPTLVSNWNNPRALLADPFSVPYGYDPAPLVQQLFGFPISIDSTAGLAELPWVDHLLPGLAWSGIAMLLIGAPVLILAIIGAFSTRAAGKIGRLGLLSTAFGLATGFVASQIITSVDSAGVPVAIFIGPAVSITCIGILMAAAAGLDIFLSRAKALLPISVTVLLIVTVGVSGALWVTPRVASTETLTTAQETALEQRQLATADTDPSLESLTSENLVSRSSAETLPATAVHRGASPLATNTLVIERHAGGLNAQVVSGPGETAEEYTGSWTSRALTGSLLQPAVAVPDTADESVRSLAAALASGAAIDPREELSRLGVAFVVLRDNVNAPGEMATAALIDSITGLTPVGLTEPAGWLWRVAPVINEDNAEDNAIPLLTADGVETNGLAGMSTARARITDQAGTTHWFLATDVNSAATGLFTPTIRVQLPAAAEQVTDPMTIQLAERADPGFHASINGEPLDAISSADSGTWNQQFELPVEALTSGGTLEIEYQGPMWNWVWLIPALLFVIAALLAIPSPAHRLRRADLEAASRIADPAAGFTDPRSFDPLRDDPFSAEFDELDGRATAPVRQPDGESTTGAKASRKDKRRNRKEPKNS